LVRLNISTSSWDLFLNPMCASMLRFSRCLHAQNLSLISCFSGSSMHRSYVLQLEASFTHSNSFMNEWKCFQYIHRWVRFILCWHLSNSKALLHCAVVTFHYAHWSISNCRKMWQFRSLILLRVFWVFVACVHLLYVVIVHSCRHEEF
jgi:hypothetical protein